jgi:hypothetical protein
MMPLRTWRSVLRARRTLILRLVLAVAAIAVGVAVVVAPGGAVTAVAVPTLLVASLAVAWTGQVTGD